VTAEGAFDSQRFGRRIVLRRNVDIAGAGSTSARPCETAVVRLGLQSYRRRVDDVEMPGVGNVRIAAERENTVTRIERALRVRSRRRGVDRQTVSDAITAADDASLERGLPALRTLSRNREAGVDRNWCG